jgi:hypothetical protein
MTMILVYDVCSKSVQTGVLIHKSINRKLYHSLYIDMSLLGAVHRPFTRPVNIYMKSYQFRYQ